MCKWTRAVQTWSFHGQLQAPSLVGLQDLLLLRPASVSGACEPHHPEVLRAQQSTKQEGARLTALPFSDLTRLFLCLSFVHCASAAPVPLCSVNRPARFHLRVFAPAVLCSPISPSPSHHGLPLPLTTEPQASRPQRSVVFPADPVRLEASPVRV